MIRKFISIVLIFSVNLFLLAHAVLPHHHHNGIPHFYFTQIEEQHDEHTSCCAHNHEEDSDSCAFDQDVDVVFKSEDHSDCDAGCSDHAHMSGSLLTAVLLSELYDTSALQLDVPITIPPYLLPYNQDPVISASGLRAPPLN